MTRDTLIRSLRFARENLCATCPYDDILDRAIDMLKQDAPRLLQPWELVGHDGAVWVEYNPARLYMDGEWMFVDYTSGDDKIMTVHLLRRHGQTVSYKDTGYGKTWRCWTGKPAGEQMDTTPWREKA